MSDPFRSFHRARTRAALRLRVPLALLVGAALVVGAWGVVSAEPSSKVVRDASSVLAQDPGAAAMQAAVGAQLAGAPGSPAAAEATGAAGLPVAVAPVAEASSGNEPGASGALPAAPVAVAPVSQPAVTAPVAPTPLYTIAVTARGYQKELDACQWVRMDLGAAAPIVGAHNFCHGDVVLAMAVGDVVTVTGTSLDGDYQVTGSRDARAGDDAAKATAGLTGDLIFQTCYWESARGLRLVTAVKVDLSLPPTVLG
ncbi:hypothetical protein [Agreia sp. COWG]|uniref:hypothetical protein n=1 Tax=Agreia sp. COWG TaxID=2773266 RepID=UPI001928F271|nr:hypothetical protein [Agreia sp. COWG]CAD5990697.1 conserved exported protein of unknown function [Agreia sp. COWG]